MTDALTTTPSQSDGRRPANRWQPVRGRFGRTRRRRKPKRLALILCMGWIGVVVIVALTVQWLPLPSYVAPAGPANSLPSWSANILGTDDIGRSVLARLVYGARVSVAISVLATLIGMVGGMIIGLLSVYLGGIVTRIVDIFANTVLAIPSLLLLLAIILAMRPTPVTLVWALGVIFIPTFMRLTRANALSQMHRDFVVAARAMGASGPRLIIREVLPNCLPPLISYAALVLPAVIITEGTLSFLGFGVQPPTPSWGTMIASAQSSLSQNPWPALIPCIVLFLTVYSLNTLGDALRVKLDVRDAKL